MEKISIKVYYDTPNGRPAKQFGADAVGAIAWAKVRADKNPVVVMVKEEVIWDGRS